MTNVVKHIHKYKKEVEPIKIIAPYKPDVINFESAEEFNEYYRSNEEEFKGLSTYKLNMKYKIPNFKITQKKMSDSIAELSLIKDYHITPGPTINEEALLPGLTNLDIRITNLENQVAKLTESNTQLAKELQLVTTYLQTLSE